MTDQKTAKVIKKVIFYPPSHRLNVNVMLSDITLVLIILVLILVLILIITAVVQPAV